MTLKKLLQKSYRPNTPNADKKSKSKQGLKEGDMEKFSP